MLPHCIALGNALEKGSAVQCSAAQGNTILRSTELDWRYRKFNVSLQWNEIEETKLFFKNALCEKYSSHHVRGCISAKHSTKAADSCKF